jgi:RNA polymerase sigma-70 factor (ECF subfamily)
MLAGNEETCAREDLFAAIVRRQSLFVFRVAFAIVRNSHDAEDVVQETFLRVYRGSAWKDMRNERAFLARTAWRIAVDRLPRSREVAAEVDHASTELGPEDAVLSAEKMAVVHRLVDALPEELRQPLALSTVYEMTSREIAGIMGIAEGTVRTRLTRARQVLKKKLERYGA